MGVLESYDITGAAVMAVTLYDDPDVPAQEGRAALAVIGCLIGVTATDANSALAYARDLAAGDVTAYPPPL